MHRATEPEIAEALASIAWERHGEELVKHVRRADFVQALAYVVEVGGLAEQEGHRPDIELSYGQVTLRLSTHSLSGLSAADFALARRIAEIDAG